MKEDFTKILNSSRWVLRLTLIIIWILPALSSSGMIEAPLYDDRLEPPINISGTVKDEKGLPLSGVSVKAVGTARAVSTSADGTYRLTSVESNATLEFSYVGFTSQRVQVNNRTTINIVLIENASALDEVLVTGYLSTTKRDLTGAIGTVNVEDMQKAPVRSFEEALAGRVAGVQVTSQDGKPGSGINILIRGLGSITQDSSPLFVVDGFPLDDPNNNAIDPATVETITVLKDASATAIYGARGSNGVIVITTKRGQKGVPRINYQGSYGVNLAPKYISLLNPFQYVQLQSLAYYTPGISSNLGTTAAPWFREGRILEDYRNNAPMIDWQDEILRPAPQQMHSISLSGGTDKTLFSISGQILGQDGVIIASDFDRYQAKVTLDQTINPKAKVGLTGVYTNLQQTGRPATANGPGALFWNAYSLRPTEVAGLETNFEELLYDPELPATDTRINPVLSTKNEINNRIENQFTGNLFGEYKFTNDFKFRSEGALNSRLIRIEDFYGANTRQGGPNGTLGVNGQVANQQITQSLLRNSLTYNKLFNSTHRLDVYGAFEVTNIKSKFLRLSGTQLPNESLGLSGIETGTINPASTTTSLSSSALVSGLTQVNYNYKSKYYLTGSFRADGSSRFRENNRWGYFPSGSVKWKLSEENFIKQIKFLSDANIRTSYGSTGNNNVGDYASYSLIQYQTQLTINNATQPNSAIVTTLDNPDLTWEKATQFDVGLDLGLFDNKFSLNVDYYKKTISDLLFNATLPGTTGYSVANKNIGQISNRGVEITLNTNLIKTSTFSWNSNFNITFNKNRLEALSTPDEEATTRSINWEPSFASIPAYIARVGQPLGQIWGLISEGVYQISDFDRLATGAYALKAGVPGATTQQPGDAKFRDINGDGVINANDRAVIGRGYPIHQGGFSNNFKYQGFDLNVFLQWSYGTEIVNANRIYYESGYGYPLRPGSNQFVGSSDRWTFENQDTDVPRFTGAGPAGYSSAYVEDGSFIRLKTLNLGYTFPKELLSRAKISSLRIYFAANNLFTLTKYEGYDPEVSTYQSGLTPGLDWSSYPRPLNISGGINLVF